jgi:C-terminal processing protease CtpA/Prc
MRSLKVFKANATDRNLESCQGFEKRKVLEKEKIAHHWIGHLEVGTKEVAECRTQEGENVKLSLQPIESGDVLGPESQKFSVKVEGDILYIRIPDFNFDVTKLTPDQHLVLQTLSDEKSKLKVIIDLRNNRGGSPSYAFKILESLSVKGTIFPETKSIQKAGPLVFAGFMNEALSLAEQAADMGNTQGEASYLNVRNQFEAMLNSELSLGRGLNDMAINREMYPGKLTGQRLTHYPSPIVLLTNKSSSSAAEVLSAFTTLLPQMIIVGQHTAGAITYGSPMSIQLPHSKVKFRGGWFGLKSEILPEEGIGFAPTFYVLEGDILESAKNYLSSLVSKE